MAWFKVDDKLHDHRKARRAGKAAMGVWVLAGSWSADNLEDGFVPESVLPRWGTEADAAKLVDVGLWTIGERDGEAGWFFHEWDERQPLREAVEEERRKARERMANLRGGSGERSGSVRPNVDGTSAGVTRPRPVPSRPVPTESSTNSPAAATADRFDDFWKTYPLKKGKGQAVKAWRAACKKADPDTIIAGLVEQLPTLAMQRRTDGDFRPHPSTWLNGERWADEQTPDAAAETDPWAQFKTVEQLKAERGF